MQLPEEGQKWGFLIWLLFSYCGLVCIACVSAGKVCDLSFTASSNLANIFRFFTLNMLSYVVKYLYFVLVFTWIFVSSFPPFFSG